MAFASELPYMDPEVAKAAIAQFPKFAESCTDLAKQLKENLEVVVGNSKEIDLKVLDNYRMLQDELLKQLPESKESEKALYINALVEVAGYERELADSNRKDMKNIFNKVVAALAITASVLAAGIGGASAIKNISSNKNDEET